MSEKTTESASKYNNLDTLNTATLLMLMNQEDTLVPLAVAKELQAIEAFIDALVPRMQQGGRLFYLGAGTSGRLGVVDASECPPTFGVPHNLVNGIIAGGDLAIRKAVEFAEDNMQQAWIDLQSFQINKFDTVVGIAASGATPYVLGGIKSCIEAGILTGGISCNFGSPLAKLADYPITVVVGPEFISGSTRLKSGTAQKLVLNMISTITMVKLGKVLGNQMVDMQLTNQKLIERGAKMVSNATGLSILEAKKVLLKEGSVRKAIFKHKA